jgi:hypothetical protein
MLMKTKGSTISPVDDYVRQEIYRFLGFFLEEVISSSMVYFRTAALSTELFVPHIESPLTSLPKGLPVQIGAPNGIRTRVAAVKGRCPRPG